MPKMMYISTNEVKPKGMKLLAPYGKFITLYFLLRSMIQAGFITFFSSHSESTSPSPPLPPLLQPFPAILDFTANICSI